MNVEAYRRRDEIKRERDELVMALRRAEHCLRVGLRAAAYREVENALATLSDPGDGRSA